MGIPTFAASPADVDDGDIDMQPVRATAYPAANASAVDGNNNNNNYEHHGNLEPTFYESALMAATASPLQGSAAVSIPPPQQTEIPMWEQPKEGSKCCGCCCDFRRAVIIINSTVIAFSTYSVMMLFNRPADMEELWGEVITDDEVLNELADIEDDGYLANAIISGIGFFATIVPIYGAYSFDNRLVGFGAGFLVVSFATRLAVAYMLIENADDVSENVMFSQPYFLYTSYAIVIALFVYGHIGLMVEIRQGIMSAETYPREEYSCCCVSRPTAFGGPLPPQSYNNNGGPPATYPIGQVAPTQQTGYVVPEQSQQQFPTGQRMT